MLKRMTKRVGVFSFLALVGLALISGGAWIWATTLRPVSGPSLQLPQYPLDLGEGRPGETVEGRFTIRNVGNAKLIYNIMPSCGCSDLNPRNGELPPGGSQEVRVSVRVEEGVRKGVSLRLHTNDPRRTDATYMVTANCPELVVIRPAQIDFGVIHAGVERSVTFHVAGPEGAPSMDPNAVKALSNCPHVSVKRSGSDSASLAFEAILAPNAPTGFLQGSIVLQIAEQDREVQVPVRAEVVGKVGVTPPSVFFSRDPKTGSIRDATVIVRSMADVALGALARADVPDGLTIEELGSPQDRLRRLRIRCDEKRLSWTTAFVRLWFRDLAEPVAIRVMASGVEPAPAGAR